MAVGDDVIYLSPTRDYVIYLSPWIGRLTHSLAMTAEAKPREAATASLASGSERSEEATNRPTALLLVTGRTAAM